MSNTHAHNVEPNELLFHLARQNLYYQSQSGQQTVLSNVSLDIHAGQKIALVGKSGSGKSTLLKHLRTLQAERCAWCPQQTGLVPMLSVYHNIFMGGLERYNTLVNLSNLLVPPKKIKAEVANIAEQLGLVDVLWKSVDQCSGGQQQRVAIGRALFQRRSILLADEPISALDDYQGEALLSQLLQTHQTAVIALHDTELALKLCDRIIGLGDQQIVFDCASANVEPQQLAQLYQ